MNCQALPRIIAESFFIRSGKFADADLIGLPFRLVVSEKSLKVGGVELKKRSESKSEIVKEKEIVEKLK